MAPRSFEQKLTALLSKQLHVISAVAANDDADAARNMEVETTSALTGVLGDVIGLFAADKHPSTLNAMVLDTLLYLHSRAETMKEGVLRQMKLETEEQSRELDKLSRETDSEDLTAADMGLPD